jgi:hypothetical protein
VKSEWVQNLIRVGAASGHVAGLLDIPYLRQAHQRRQRILEAASSSKLDGRETSAERLYSWLSDIPLEAYGNLGGEAHAAEIFRALVKPEATELGRDGKDLARQAREEADEDPIEAAALLFRGRDRIHAASRLGYAFFLRRLFGPAEPAASAAMFGLQAAAKRSRADFDQFVAKALAKAAAHSLAKAADLRSAVLSAQAALTGDRQTSHIHSVAELLFAGHPLSQAEAARLFKISRLSARTHLLRLVELGLAEVATRRKSGQIFVARDGVMTFAGAPLPRFAPTVFGAAAPLQKALVLPMTPDQRARLDSAHDEVAARIADLDRLLDRLKSNYRS